MQPKTDNSMTVGEIRRLLQGLPEDGNIMISGLTIDIHRLKQRGDNLWDIEVNNFAQGYRSDGFKARNPHAVAVLVDVSLNEGDAHVA